jgi:adenylosuccinate synthase
MSTQSKSDPSRETSCRITISIGAQWGDEGKGKWIDVLAGNADIVARYQGGNNAGHTLYVKGEKVVLHQLPSGIFQSHKIAALAAGVVVNPTELVAEMADVKKFVELNPETLWLSSRAHVITPWHIFIDGRRESEAAIPIGTTKRGIGPTYADKAARTGLRLAAYVDRTKMQAWLKEMSQKSTEFSNHLASHKDEWDAFQAAAKTLAPFVCSAEEKIRASARAGKKLLLEGAQGALLDIDHGTYPFVTSSSTSAAAACQYIGLPPKAVDRVIGIAKAYLTRVGTGPFPTELQDETGKLIGERGAEFGATTGRPRRCGWLDIVALKYVAELNGLDGIILNKIDILTGLPEIKAAIAYEHPKLGRVDSIPSEPDILEECTPVYETFKGWTADMPKSGTVKDMPKEAQAFVARIEELVGVPIIRVGTGPGPTEGLMGFDLEL